MSNVRLAAVDFLHSCPVVLPKVLWKIVSVRDKTLSNTNLAASRFIKALVQNDHHEAKPTPYRLHFSVFA